MNRQLKRAQAKQERQAEKAAITPTRAKRAQVQQQAARQRVGVAQFFREVAAEMKKVAWPTRSEVWTSTIIVLVTVVILTSLIFGLDYAFGKLVLAVFG